MSLREAKREFDERRPPGAMVARGEKVLVMENVNAPRVAVRSIAWLGDLLAGIVKLSKLGSKK